MLRIILASLRKRVKRFALVFVQFFIGLTVLLFGMFSVERFFRYERNVEQVLPADMLHLMGAEEETGVGTEDGPVVGSGKGAYDYEQVMEEVRKEVPGLKLGVFENVLIEAGDEEASFLMCSREVLEMVHISADQSEMEQLADYKGGETVPVLVSSDLAEDYEVGEEYPFPDDTMPQFASYRMRIAGMMEEGAGLCMGGSSDLSSSIKTAEHTIVGPEIFAFDPDYAYEYNLVCLTAEGTDQEELKTEFSKRGWDVGIQSVREEIQKYFEREKTVMFGAIGFSAILLVLSAVGCVGTLLSMVLSRKKEFGIYFSLGMKKRDLAVMVLGEVSVIFMASYLGALCAFAVIVQAGMDGAGFVPAASMTMTMAVMFLCAVLCVILPVRKIMQWKPVELLSKAL